MRYKIWDHDSAGSPGFLVIYYLHLLVFCKFGNYFVLILFVSLSLADGTRCRPNGT